jgi:hypothetical protein
LLSLSEHANTSGMPAIDAELLAQLPLSAIRKVTFYKRDEVTTDLICCDVEVGDEAWTFHEELVGWSLLVEHLQRLPGFASDWFAAVSQPPFAESKTVAFSRE